VNNQSINQSLGSGYPSSFFAFHQFYDMFVAWQSGESSLAIT
jgi:hypothetical protein